MGFSCLAVDKYIPKLSRPEAYVGFQLQDGSENMCNAQNSAVALEKAHASHARSNSRVASGVRRWMIRRGV